MSAADRGASNRTILVVGATGNQGGSVARSLIGRGFSVHGMTRDPSQPAAQELESLGIEMVKGDLYEPSTLEPFVAEADGVFGVSDFWSEGYEGQVEQVTNLARASADAGVEHFVFSGVGGSERDTGVPHFDSCDEIEGNIRDLDLPYTFLRPVFFMQNYEPFYEDILAGTLALPVEEETNHQMIDLEDIGRVAAQVFADPGRYVGQAYELAGDEGTLADVAAVFSDVLGRKVEPLYLPIEDAREGFGDEFADMCQWFIDEGYQSDIAGMNQEFGPLTTLREYLERENWGPDKSAPSSTPSWADALL